MAPSHGFRPPPATASDPRADHDIALLRSVAELPGPIDSGRSVDSNEGVASTPLHHPPKMGLFHDAASRVPPRLLDKGVQVSRTRGGLRLALRCNADLRFRSLGWFFGHRPTPWIFGFARRYISRPGSRKRCAKDRGLLKALRASSDSRVAAP